MNANKKSKGFTLVELLVVIVILGIITAISIPVVRNISMSNEERQYNVYKETLVHGAKLYLDSYGDDLFGTSEMGCAQVKYQDLVDKGLIKDISLSDVSCKSDNTFVKIIKVDDKYGYSAYIDCGKIGNNGQPQLDPNNHAAEEQKCDPTDKTIMTFSTDPENSTTGSFKNKNITLSITSNTGIRDNISIQYGFSTDRNSTSPEGGWKSLNVDMPGSRAQKTMLENGEAIVATAKVTTPTNATGKYYLILKVTTLENLDGQSWTTETLPIEKTTFGYFAVDNTKPQWNASTIISTNTSYNTLTPQLKLAVTDLIAPTNKLRMCVTYDSATACPTSNINDLKTSSRYETYNANKTLAKIQDNYELAGSHAHTIHVTVVDPAGNFISKDFPYEVAYIIKYDKNNGTGTTDTSYCNRNVDCPLRANAFSRTGYTFVNWNTKADGAGTSYAVGTKLKLTENKTVYAFWDANDYSIAYTMNGGTKGASAPTSVTYDQVIPITKPTKVFTVNVNANSQGAAIKNSSGTAVTKATSNQTFAGWTATSLATATAKYGASNTTVTTAWSAGTTKVGATNATTYFKNLRSNGGSVTLTANWTAVNVTLPTLTKTGYTCKYNTAANGSGTSYNSGAAYTPSTTTDNVTLYVRCTPNTYTVSFNANGCSGGQSANVTATYDAAMPAISTTKPSRTGYTFQGWYDTSAASGGTQYYTASCASARAWNKTSNTTLYARCTPNSYTVSFNANGGSGGQSANVTAKYDAAMPAISTTKPTKTGYSFQGWYDTSAASGGTQYYTANCTSARTWNKTSNTTLYARWKANTYTVSFNANGGSGGQTANVTATYNSAMPTITTTKPTKTGYIFGGWYDTNAASGGTQYYTAAGASARVWNKTSNATLYARWTAKTIAVTFNCNGGSGGGSQTFTYGVAGQAFNKTCTRTGHTISGWTTQSNGGGEYYTTASGVADSWINGHAPSITIYAKWTPNNYYFDLNGYLDGGIAYNIDNYGTVDVYMNGSLVSNDCSDYYVQWPYGTRYEIKDIKAKAGRAYNGVYSGSISGTIGAGNVAVHLNFSSRSYTVYFDGNGGSGASAKTVTYGSTYGNLPGGSRGDHSFNGWYTARSGGTKINSNTTVTITSNQTLYAHWTYNPPPPPPDDDDDDGGCGCCECCCNSDCCCWCGCGCGGCSGGCFLGKTKVVTAFGLRDIDKIRAGDLVLSFNDVTKRNEYKRVIALHTYDNATNFLFTFNIEGSILKVTDKHPFYVRRGNQEDWMNSEALKVGDYVRYSDGSYHRLDSTSYVKHTEVVYNLKVEDNNNYYVGENQVLVFGVGPKEDELEHH